MPQDTLKFQRGGAARVSRPLKMRQLLPGPPLAMAFAPALAMNTCLDVLCGCRFAILPFSHLAVLPLCRFAAFAGPAIDYLTCFMRTASYVPTGALICLLVCGLGPNQNVQTNCRSAGAGRKSAQQSKHISSINGQWPMAQANSPIANWPRISRLGSMAP